MTLFCSWNGLKWHLISRSPWISFSFPVNCVWRQSEIKTKPNEQPKARMGSKVDGAGGRKTNWAFPPGSLRLYLILSNSPAETKVGRYFTSHPTLWAWGDIYLLYRFSLWQFLRNNFEKRRGKAAGQKAGWGVWLRWVIRPQVHCGGAPEQCMLGCGVSALDTLKHWSIRQKGRETTPTLVSRTVLTPRTAHYVGPGAVSMSHWEEVQLTRVCSE